MTNPMRRTVPAVVAGALGMGAVAAWANQPVAQDQSSPAITAAVRDASSSSQFLAAGGGSAGYDSKKGLYIEQGDFSLGIHPGMQFRGVLNYGKDRKNGDGSDIKTGFEVTRARLEMQGSAFTKDLEYYIQIAADETGGASLLDAVACYRIASEMKVFAGQFKDLVTHEGLVNWSETVGVARSLANQLLGTADGLAGRVQGVGISYESGQMRAMVALTDGVASGNTTFVDGAANWGLSGRVEMMVTGKSWDEYNTMTARGTKGDLLVVGGGASFSQGDNFNGLAFAIDGQFEMQNLSLYGAFLGRWIDPRNVAGDDSTFDWGIVAQAAFALADNLEVFGRFDLINFDAEQINGEDTTYEIVGGINYYLSKVGNGAKVSVDVAWLPNGCPTAVPYLNILGGSDEAEIVVRTQLQLRP